MILDKAGVQQAVIEKLAHYVSTELFDTEGMEIDLEIEKGGNIENNMDNNTCIACIKSVFTKANSFVFTYSRSYSIVSFYVFSLFTLFMFILCTYFMYFFIVI